VTGTCLHELVEAQAARTPAAVAVSAEAGSLTYADLDRRADRVAARLQDLGAGPERVVAVRLERSLELPVALLGALKSGAACLPVDAGLPVEQVAPRLRDAGAMALLTDGRLRSRPEEPPVEVVQIEDEERWEAAPRDRADRAVFPANLAYVAWTAGSSGRPLAALLPHGAAVDRVERMRRAHELEVGEAVLHRTSLSVHVSLLELFWPLVSGARIVMARPRRDDDPRYLWDLVEREGVSTVHFAPTFLRVFLGEQPAGAGRGLKRVLCGGEALPGDLAERCRARLDAELHDLYGSAETGVLRLETPVAGTRAYAATGDLALAPEGVAGRLYVGGPGLARGYGGMPGLTAERFVPDPFGPEPGARLHRTDDLARWREGRLECAGRADRQVEVQGQRIELAEIEAALRRQDGVTDAVVGTRQIDGETTLVAYVEAGILWRRLAHLRDALRRELPDVLVPRAWVVVDELPLTPGGTVDWSALPEPDPDDLQQEYVAPRDGLERQLADIWQEVFALDRIGVNDDFFDLGGHSLLAVQIAMRLEPLAGGPVAVAQVLERPTVAELAAGIREWPREASGAD
jgi:amino acid adenylation domain-containing protein